MNLSFLKEKKNKYIVIILMVLLVLVLLMPTSSKESEGTGGTLVSEGVSERETEAQLKRVLSAMEGVGEVEVMITLESCYENVYAKGYSTQSDVDDSGVQSQITEEYVIIKNGSSTEECLVIKVYEPKIKGVAVVAEGADNAQVKKAITDTVCALFDISSNKVSVIKKYEE